jgi:hypothetical protein
MVRLRSIALAAAVCVSAPMAAQAGLLPTTASVEAFQNLKISLIGGGGVISLQSTTPAFENAGINGSATFSTSVDGFVEDFDTGTACVGSQSCVSEETTVLSGQAFDGSAVVTLTSRSRVYGIDVEVPTQLKVELLNERSLSDGADGDGKMIQRASGAFFLPFTLDALSGLTPVPLGEFSLVDAGDMFSLDLDTGQYELSVGGIESIIQVRQLGSVTVSEPSTMAIVGLGVLGLAIGYRRSQSPTIGA